jgi:hypothetical protein
LAPVSNNVSNVCFNVCLIHDFFKGNQVFNF